MIAALIVSVFLVAGGGSVIGYAILDRLRHVRAEVRAAREAAESAAARSEGARESAERAAAAGTSMHAILKVATKSVEDSGAWRSLNPRAARAALPSQDSIYRETPIPVRDPSTPGDPPPIDLPSPDDR